MNVKNPYQSVIVPVPDGLSRPLWSVMIPTYNCAEYLRETLASILVQDPGLEVMQIEVVDDYSTKDDPEAVVKELAGDRVSFYRQSKNVGYIKNFETCLQRSRGRLIHLLHGDDCVRDGFYSKMQNLFKKYPEIGAAFCRHIIMDDDGHWQWFSRLEETESGVLSNWLERVAVVNPLQTPSMVVKRDVYEKLGGFDSRVYSCGEDWEMWVRIAAHYQVGYEVEPLALYRDRSNSITKRSIITGQNIKDVRKVTEIIQPYLPESKASTIIKQARENCAAWAIHFAKQMIAKGDIAAAMTQLKEAIKCSFSWKVIKSVIRLTLSTGKRWMQKKYIQTS